MSVDDDEVDALDDGLENQDYEIKNELQIRKILEANTDWNFEFRKNGKYSYDLCIREWEDKPTGPNDNDVLGFVELERSRSDKKHSWITGDIPDSWVFYSFLERKIRKYDAQKQCFTELKENHQITVYMKFNHALDNCFVAPVTVIYRDGDITPLSDGTRTRTTRALNLNHPEVVTGIEDAVKFTEEYLGRTDNNQGTLFDF